ncbi:MAG: flagellar basal body P-ring formation chaperone FlgA [Melioribacteraceae bacterium]|nr:flagellar basal body P-ring formation chaperone FlgA [Melioribacteraceae bacterium]
MLSLINILLFVLVNTSNFETELKKYLDSKLNNYDSYEFEIVKNPVNTVKITIDETKEFKILNNFGYVPVKILISKNEVKSSVLTIKLKLYKKCFVTKRTINSEQLLNKDFLEKKLVDITQFNGKIFSTEENLGEYKTKINLKEGLVLMYEHLKKIPLVNKGDKVILHAGNSVVNVTVEATTREEGYLGDVISVQALNKIFKAKVIDKQNLVVVN